MATFEEFNKKYLQLHQGRHEQAKKLIGKMSRTERREDLENLYKVREISFSADQIKKYKSFLITFPQKDGLEVFNVQSEIKRKEGFENLSDSDKKHLIQKIENYDKKRTQFEILEPYIQNDYAAHLWGRPEYIDFFNIPSLVTVKPQARANAIYDLPELEEEIYNTRKKTLIGYIENVNEANEIAGNLGAAALGPDHPKQTVKLDDGIKALFENGKLKKGIAPNQLEAKMEGLRSYQKEVGGLSEGVFTVPVGTGESKEIDPKAFEIESNRYNGPWISTARSGRNSHKNTHKTRYGKYAGWTRSGDRPKLVWHNYSPVSSITGSSNILTDLLDLGASVVGNSVNAATLFQGRKWLSEFKNRAKSMIGFAKKYMGSEYRAYFGKKAAEMENNPESLRSLLWIRKFFKSKKSKYQSPEGFNKIAKDIRDQRAKDLNGKDAMAEFETWGFIGRKFYGNSWVSRNLGFTGAGRLFEKDDIKMQRRALQYAQSGGNYVAQMKKATQTSRELIRFLEKENPELLKEPKLDMIRVSIKELDDAEKKSFDGTDQYRLQNRVFDAIQNADLRHKKNHPIVQKIVDSIEKSTTREVENKIAGIADDISDEENQKLKKKIWEDAVKKEMTALKKMNFLVGNISRKRVEWYDLWSRVFPEMYDLSREKNDGMRLSNILNKPLILGDYAKDMTEEEFVKTVLEDAKKEFKDALYEGLQTKIPFAPEGLRQKLEKRFGLGPKSKEFTAPVLSFKDGKLTEKSRKKFKSFLEKVQREQGFKKILNKGAVGVEEKEEDGSKRYYIKLNDELLRKISYAYSVIFRKPPADNIDEVDKVNVRNATNKVIKDLDQSEYESYVGNIKEYGKTENLPFYIALKKMDFAIKTIQETGKYSDTFSTTYKSAFETAVKETELVEKLLDELKKKGADKYLFKENSNFADSYEERVRNLKEVMNLYDNVLWSKEKEALNGKDEKKRKIQIKKDLKIVNAGLESKAVVENAIPNLEDHLSWLKDLRDSQETGARISADDQELITTVEKALNECYDIDIKEKIERIVELERGLKEIKEEYIKGINDLEHKDIVSFEDLKQEFEKSVKNIDGIKKGYDPKNAAYETVNEEVDIFEKGLKKEVAKLIEDKEGELVKEKDDKAAEDKKKAKEKKDVLKKELSTYGEKLATLNMKIRSLLKEEGKEIELGEADKEATTLEIEILKLEQELEKFGISIEDKVKLNRLKKQAGSMAVDNIKKDVVMEVSVEAALGVVKEEIKKKEIIIVSRGAKVSEYV